MKLGLKQAASEEERQAEKTNSPAESTYILSNQETCQAKTRSNDVMRENA